MKCDKCGITVLTVGDAWSCPRCATDGTAAQMTMPAITPIEEAVKAAPGLANRFKAVAPVLVVVEVQAPPHVVVKVKKKPVVAPVVVRAVVKLRKKSAPVVKLKRKPAPVVKPRVKPRVKAVAKRKKARK